MVSRALFVLGVLFAMLGVSLSSPTRRRTLPSLKSVRRTDTKDGTISNVIGSFLSSADKLSLAFGSLVPGDEQSHNEWVQTLMESDPNTLGTFLLSLKDLDSDLVPWDLLPPKLLEMDPDTFLRMLAHFQEHVPTITLPLIHDRIRQARPSSRWYLYRSMQLETPFQYQIAVLSLNTLLHLQPPRAVQNWMSFQTALLNVEQQSIPGIDLLAIAALRNEVTEWVASQRLQILGAGRMQLKLLKKVFPLPTASGRYYVGNAEQKQDLAQVVAPIARILAHVKQFASPLADLTSRCTNLLQEVTALENRVFQHQLEAISAIRQGLQAMHSFLIDSGILFSPSSTSGQWFSKRAGVLVSYCQAEGRISPSTQQTLPSEIAKFLPYVLKTAVSWIEFSLMIL